MRVLGVLAAWGVLAVLATLCFAVGGSIGYRRGVSDAVRQLRERRNGKTGCRPMPMPRHTRRPVTRLRNPAHLQHSVMARSAVIGHGIVRRVRVHSSPAVVGALVTLCVLIVPGVAVGATAAQPGEALWNVKRGMEHARLVMAVGPSRDAVIHADLAARRLTELNQLLSRDGADPAVVDTVIHSLRDHTESATDQLNQTAVAERAAVADRLDGSVERQIAVIDMLLGFDCAEQAGPHCVALTGTRVASVRLQRTTTAIAAADAASDGPAEGPAPDTNAPADVAGVEPSDVDSALSASATASEPPSEPSSEGATAESSEDSTAAPSTPAAGEGTSETSGDESSGSSDPPSDPESQPSSPSSSTDSGSSTDPGSSTNSGSSTTSTVEKLGSDLDDATDAVTESLLP